MKILTLHSDYIKFQAKKKAIKNAEPSDQNLKQIKECLVVLTAVESTDEKNIEWSANKLTEEIKDIARQVKTGNIVLYPYAHLSSKLAKPDNALKILKLTEKKLKPLNVTRAPFGYYKSFEVKCKGHPLSELSREFSPEKKQEESEALQAEKKLVSHWYILDEKGKLTEASKFNFKKYTNLKKFANYEEEKVRAVKQEPPHVKIMKKLQLADYEPASDPGNFRFYPKGRLIKSLLEEFVNNKVRDYGGLEVETPIMYDMEHPTLKRYLQKFPARQYNIESDKKTFFLRFAACFGQFLMAHDAIISYKHLPLKLYELTRYSFRREQRGELTGLRRLRAFTMPDVHCFCEDLKQAIEELKIRLDLCIDVTEKIGFSKDDYEIGIRTTRNFYNEHKEIFNLIVKKLKKPVLIEMWDERKFYFVFKYEFNFVDSMDKASALSTDQIDVENGERYNINFINEEGKKQHPLILHCSPSGSIERVIYALLEKIYKEEKNTPPTLPLWLSPTQVRIIPVSVDKHLKQVEKLQKEFTQNNIRADIDDTSETISKRIRNSELEWVPYTIVIGDKELKSKKINVRIKKENKQKQIEIKKFIKEIKDQTKDMPYKQLPLNVYLSKRPSFI
ncbi:threonine--tRNA ligase [archaeon]|nr:threonine--tRNA ligase [archaeon]